MVSFRFDPVTLPASTLALRDEVRAFLAEELAAGRFTPHRNSWGTFDAEFSRRCGERGFIGMRWPQRYGGREASALDRHVVIEEMLAAGAPVGAHWIADRQSGNNILANGSEAARASILPRIAAGECYFAIGMSEPDSGSDLASVGMRATRTDGGWRLNGTKIWTSVAHRAHYLIALARTAPPGDDRRAGLTQFIVAIDAANGVTTRPIHNLYGAHEFNEVLFEDTFVPDDMIVGEIGAGWQMVTGELAFERSGPDRILSTFQLLRQLVARLAETADARSNVAVGRLVAHLVTLRQMSWSVAGMLERGASPELEASVVKDVGTAFEQEIPEIARLLVPEQASLTRGDLYGEALAQSVLSAPCFTIRGGTREILRGIIARGLGLR
ncbi:acyl-CoA dehydrogenase [Salinisphaera orenii MK-B5]|uniref:Acyl-CoA dehydrogenase n=1 Tax=Salinisphaera orenii MK-B5 TaxID=856730 RepID=A0A423PH85_9GAMM|nr:acyl-CoA dehydrogenase family protein [Salinisphaera orenii]ROO24988.1 acyl-CoA dehydrogenase [Salinisphaera orenii MK-B5]